MIEDKIDKLNDNIEALNLILNHFWEARVDQVEHPVVVRTVKPEKSETKTEKSERDSAEKPAQPITHQQLHRMASNLVAGNNKETGKKIKALLKGLNVDLIKDLKGDQLAEFKEGLETLS